MTITMDRPTAHRRTRKTFAEKVADRFDQREAVSVTVDKYGPGWWVTVVDRVTETFEVYRDGGSMTVAWAAVSP